MYYEDRILATKCDFVDRNSNCRRDLLIEEGITDKNKHLTVDIISSNSY